jgi:predicted peptidase
MQSKKVFQAACRVALQYLLFLPDGYGENPDDHWPLILFLHGKGERGAELEMVKAHGIPRIVREQPDFPFIAISPQCPDGTFWWHHFHTLDALLADVTQAYAVDRRRIYLTGLSMGGYGSWLLASMFPGWFAAVAPVCGGGLAHFNEGLLDLPVWAFHGAEDPVVQPDESRRMVAMLERQGAANIRLTIYPGVGHNSWEQAYREPELYRWMLSHRKTSY